MPAGAPRALGLTALGLAGAQVPGRDGARPGDDLWVSGTIGDAGAGLALLRRGESEPAALIERYRTPRPRLEAGQRLAAMARAMMDVSDGLLIDAARMAAASGCAARIELDMRAALRGADRPPRRWPRDRGSRPPSAGDDYELLFAAPNGVGHRDPRALADELGLSLSQDRRLRPMAPASLSSTAASPSRSPPVSVSSIAAELSPFVTVETSVHPP